MPIRWLRCPFTCWYFTTASDCRKCVESEFFAPRETSGRRTRPHHPGDRGWCRTSPATLVLAPGRPRAAGDQHAVREAALSARPPSGVCRDRRRESIETRRAAQQRLLRGAHGGMNAPGTMLRAISSIGTPAAELRGHRFERLGSRYTDDRSSDCARSRIRPCRRYARGRRGLAITKSKGLSGEFIVDVRSFNGKGSGFCSARPEKGSGRTTNYQWCRRYRWITRDV
jgi:hypothetical protein